MAEQSSRTETNTSTFFTQEQKNAIKTAIEQAEKRTSGEIKVHLEPRCDGDVLVRAAAIFEKLHMHKTAQRNGVLFYLAYDDRRFAIFGDAGINAVVPENFWDVIKVDMQVKFRGGQFLQGLVDGITKAGEHLATHFPLQKDDINELPNDISFG
jgi:uncharacterized membrane protein